MRLKYRLSILFLVVIAVGAAVSLLLVRRNTESMFRSFVFSGDARKAKAYAMILGEYRAAKGSWEDVQGFLTELPDLLSEMVDTRIHPGGGWPSITGYTRPTLRSLMEDRVVVADERGIIVADTADQLLGTAHPSRHLAHGIPVMSDFERTGTVLVASMIDSSLTGADGRFLESVTASLVWATVASAAIALFVGLLFAERITRPLGVLAGAAKRVATGDLGIPVPVGGRDEVADLSASFNEMVAELRRLDAAKKQVIADSAHELRTPVTLIQGIIEGMIDGVFPRDDRTLESVYEETVRLSRLIGTLRELEIVESGELELSKTGVDLREAIQRAVLLFAPIAAAKSISLSAEISGGHPAVASGDALRIGEVLYNLLANAIEYTSEGGTVIVRERDGPGKFAGFVVDDSGPGIPVEERSRVFERFYRVDKSRAPDRGGRGLGLAIASEIVKAHGGTLAAESSPLGGARFAVALARFTA